MIDSLLVGIVGSLLLFGQLGRISLGNGVQFYALELLVGFHVMLLLLRKRGAIKHLITSCGVEMKKKSKLRISLKHVSIAWFLYVIALYLLTMWGKESSDNVKAGMYIVRVSMFALYFALLSYVHNCTYVVGRVVRIITIVTPALCLLQYIFVPDLRFLAQIGWDPHMYRAVGLIFDPPVAGVVLGMLFFISLVKNNRVGITLNFLAIIFLFSRSTYIAVGSVTFLYLFYRKQYGLSFIWIVLLSLAIYLAPKTIPAYMNLESSKIERVSTVLSRRVEIENGLRAWNSRPIFGIGYNRVGEYKKSLPSVYGSDIALNHSSSAFHSFWLTQLASTGVVGFSLLAGAYLLAMRKNVLWALILAIPALIGILDNVVFHPFVLTLFILVYFSKVLDQPSSYSTH
ncbi:O-antigen ligase family protein [Candidatus Woesebacteria bacterium]|nr:O-antigen ligase family protein [Candidatus Woesebacteria bacterium]